MTRRKSAAASERVRFEIDGQAVDAPPGTPFMQVLDAAGRLEGDDALPALCWHPGLSASGSCRTCRVAVRREGATESEIEAACTLDVEAGMEIDTRSERVVAARRHALELHLSRHPIECPICDRNGECDLQRAVWTAGPHASRGTPARPAMEKREPIGASLILDHERCIRCERCVRFLDEVTKTPVLRLEGKGEGLSVTRVDEGSVSPGYAENLVDLCPAGAINDPTKRPVIRPWDLASARGVCHGCSRGCNLLVDHAKDRVVRFRPRRNDAVNATWLCDAGRAGFATAREPGRLTRPMLRDEHGALISVSLAEALDEAAGRIAEMADAKGAGVVGGLASGHVTNEDLYAFHHLLSGIGTDNRALSVPMAEGDDLLVLPERAANGEGARAMGFGSPAALLDRLRGGGLEVLIVMGHDLLGAELEGDASALERLDSLILLDTAPSALLRQAHVVLPGRVLVEKRGSVTNAAARVQRIEPAVAAPAGTMDEGETCDRVARLLGLEPVVSSWDPLAVSTRLAAEVPRFAGAAYAELGWQGRCLVGDAEAESA